ncbi:hypothetical protein SprV_0501952900 [Sparganum proliferum]
MDDKSKGIAIPSQLDDDVYDLARASSINSTTPVADIFRDLCRILCGSTPTWLLRSEFRRPFQGPFERVVEFQQALPLLGRQAYPTLAAADLKETLLEQFINGVSDPEFHKALVRQQPSKLDDAFRLAQKEEALQASCATSLRGCIGVASMRSQSAMDVSTQTPWRQCVCGSYSPRQTNWRRPPIRRPTGHQGCRPVEVVVVEQEDNTSGYWQVEVRPTDREKTAFAAPSGPYEFETMPFGLANTPSTFQRLTNQLRSQLIPNSCLVYMDDITVLGKDFENHLTNLRCVFLSLKQAGLTLKPSNEGVGKFILAIDASDTAISAVLSQQQRDGTERVIQYLSRTLTEAERRYCVTRKEMVPLRHYVEEFRPYL